MHPRNPAAIAVWKHSPSTLIILALAGCPDTQTTGGTGGSDTGGNEGSTTASDESTDAGPTTGPTTGRGDSESTGAPDPSLGSTDSSTTGTEESEGTSGASTDPATESSTSTSTGGDDEGSSSSSTGEPVEVTDSIGESDTEGEVNANLVTNPDFEVNTAGWTPWGGATIAISSEQAHSGTFAGIIANRTATWQTAVYSLLGAVQAEEQYDVSFWARLGNAASDIGQVTVQSTCDGESATYTQLGSATLVDGDWTELTGVLTVPTCTLTALNVYVEGPASGVDFFIDDVSVTLRPPPVNVLPNPDFEIDAAGWFGWGAITVAATAERAHGGLQSGVATDRTASWQGPAYGLLGLVSPGSSYQAHAWVSIGGGESATTSLTVASTCDGADQTYSQLASAVANEAGWTQLSGTLNVPNCTLTGITLYVEGPAAGIDVYLDDVSVAE